MLSHFKARKLTKVLWIAGFSCLLTSCAMRSTQPSVEVQTQKLAETQSKGGYVAGAEMEIDSQREAWVHDRVQLDTMMTMPTAAGNYPLIIYLPSLGEEANAGRIWRETWAKAGYAVFSLQPVLISQALREIEAMKKLNPELEREDGFETEDEVEQSQSLTEGWFGGKLQRPSRSAQNSELRYLGHEYFAVDNLKQRMQQVFWAYQQLKTRKSLGQLASVDLSKVIIAGYDLGAQTVAGVIGENFDSALPESPEFKPLAAITISPSVNLAKGNVRSRFQAIKLPLLVVTGTEDNDPYAISSASVRTSLWEHAAAGSKYLLMLQNAGHQVLAGSEVNSRFAAGRRGLSDQEQFGSSQIARRNSHANEGLIAGLMGDRGRRNIEQSYKQVAAVASVSSAFMDAVVKNDEFARFWLADKAIAWLGNTAQIRQR
ncbi:MAG: hypothetical protein RLZ92_841 [Pseudomonadota bacterium]|jgi:pimeloyl-ACP methyl ester carboxylesterase